MVEQQFPTLGLILAGGLARRMGGGDKARLAVGGVTILTGVATTASTPSPRDTHRTLWLASLLPLSLLLLPRKRQRRKPLPRLGILALLCILATLSGCGSGRVIPPPGYPTQPPGATITPSGTYTIAVSATSAGLIRTLNLTLIVQ